MMRRRILAAAAAVVLALGVFPAVTATKAEASDCYTVKRGNLVTTTCYGLTTSKVRSWAKCGLWSSRVYGPWITTSSGSSQTGCWTWVESYGRQYASK